MVKGLIGALIGGLIGGGVWAAISYSTGYEVGWVAWGIGVLVGIGMAMGAGDDRNIATGVLATVIALVSIAGGKFIAVHLMVADQVKTMHAGVQTVSDEDVKLMLADQLVDEYSANGKKLTWKKDMTAELAEKPEDYPSVLWKDVETRWSSMTPEHQEQYRVTMRDSRKALVQAIAGAVEKQGFLESFAPMDALFAMLAVASAFKIGGDFGGD